MIAPMSPESQAVCDAFAAAARHHAEMRDEHRRAAIINAAVKIAKNAPAKPGANVSSALIWWPLIIDLRRALDDAGIDWTPR